MRKMLQWEPEKRSCARELVEDEWIVKHTADVSRRKSWNPMHRDVGALSQVSYHYSLAGTDR
jgi:hypothetical protein